MGRYAGAIAMTLILTLMSFFPVAGATADSGRSVKEVRFEKGRSSTVIKGRIQGYGDVDYRLRAGAGQTLKVRMTGSNGANYFNVIAPGAGDVAMYVGQTDDNSFDAVLPIEGVYTLRVYLMRAAARRNETSNYTLDISVTGSPLEPLPGKADAQLPGTPYHASTTIPCALPYDRDTKHCDAYVIRRDFEGTATVEVRGPKSYLRRVLFIKGNPVSSDSSRPMTVLRRGEVTDVEFDQDERLEIPDLLIRGG